MSAPTESVLPAITTAARRGVEVEVHQTLVLSTAHMTAEDNQRLLTENGVPWIVRHYEYGWTVWATPRDPDLDHRPMSEAFNAVMEFGKSIGCEWITFDSDGPHVAQLASFDW